MATKTRVNAWRTDKPPEGVWLEVWAGNKVTDAEWNGRTWRDRTGRTLENITHWMEIDG